MSQRYSSIITVLFLFHLTISSSFKATTSNRLLYREGFKPIRKVQRGNVQMAAAIGPTLASAAVLAGVVAIHEAGHFLAAKWQGIKVDSYNIGYGPKVLAFNDSSDTEFALRALPLGGYVSFPNNLIIDQESGEVTGEKDDPNLLQNRPPLQRALVISAGVIANLLLTFFLCAATALYSGVNTPIYNDGVLVTATPDVSSPAFRAGIRPNDIISKINKQPILGSESAIEAFVTKIRQNGQNIVELELVRQDGGLSKKVNTFVVPTANSKGKVSIGINIVPRMKEVENIKAKNLPEAAQLGVRETSRLVSFTYGSLSRAVSSGFVANDMGGPISVVKTGAEMANYSPIALVGFAAALSVNLAVINSFPFPALDGGQFAFVLVELFFKKPVPRKLQDITTFVAFGFLLVFSASTIIGDIDKISEPWVSTNIERPMFPGEK